MVFFLILGMAAGRADGQSQAPSNVFFSQGQAVYNAQESMKSQREALQDFQLQAIAQAASVVLSPAQIGKQFRQVQEKIFKQPQRYIQNYQVFSEGPVAGGLYRVAGQVAISMDLLKKDLMALPSVPPEKETGRVASPGRQDEGSAAGQAEGSTEVVDQRAAAGSEIFWAVVEKWEEDWHLPRDRRDPEGPFAASVSQELQDYGWALRFARTETLTPDEDGQVAAGQVLRQAASLGLRHVVIGRVGPEEKGDGETRIVVALHVHSTASEKGEGEIHREVTMGDETSNEVAIELASFLVPQLDRLLRSANGAAAENETTAADETVGRADEATGQSEDTIAQPEEPGELVVQVQSTDAYADWRAIETKLRERAPDMQVKGLEIGPAGSRVRLMGVDAATLKGLHGTRLPNGAEVQVTSPGAGGHFLRISVSRSAVSPAEPKP